MALTDLRSVPPHLREEARRARESERAAEIQKAREATGPDGKLVQPTPKSREPIGALRLMEIRLLRNYVPRAAIADDNGNYGKHFAGEVIELPEDEAKDLIKAGIANFP